MRRRDVGYVVVTGVLPSNLRPPQQAAIARILIEEAKRSPIISELRLDEALKKAVAAGILKTKHAPWRLFQFFRASLINDGVIEAVEIDPIFALHEKMGEE